MICCHGLMHCRTIAENKTHNNDHAPLTRGAVVKVRVVNRLLEKTGNCVGSVNVSSRACKKEASRNVTPPYVAEFEDQMPVNTDPLLFCLLYVRLSSYGILIALSLPQYFVG